MAGLGACQTSTQNFDMEYVYGDWTRFILKNERVAARSAQPLDELVAFVYAKCVPEERTVIQRLTEQYRSEQRAWEIHTRLKDNSKHRSRGNIAKYRVEAGR